MKPIRRCLAPLAIAVLVAGCGGSSGSSAPAPSSASPSSAPASAAVSLPNLQALLDEKRSGYGAPGGLAILRVGDREVSAVSGTADNKGAPLTAEARFRIASITKPIVATLVLRSVARGQLKLDNVVGDLLPGVLRPEPKVTVRQLLDHTSGVFDESNDGDPVVDMARLADPALKAEAADLYKRYQAGERVIGPDRLVVALSETHDRYFAPGTNYHYSNTNYQLAAMVVEKVTGKTLAELLRTEIVEPLGLKHTTIAPPDTASPEFRGYGTSTTDGSLVDITDDLVTFGNGGNGGIISTDAELLTIMQAIVSGKLVEPALLVDMKTPALQGYGLGLATYTFTCGTFYGHEGGVNGTASIAIVSATGDRGVVAALNLRSGDDPHLPAFADSIICGIH